MLGLDKFGLGAIARRPLTHHRKEALGSLNARNLGFDSHQACERKRRGQDQAKRATGVQDPAATPRGLALGTARAAPGV